MSDAIAFDTHRFVKNLTQNGFTEQQAEALANEQVHLLNSNLATKVDILAVQADIQAFKAAVQADVQAVQADVQAVKADLEAFKLGLEAKIEASKVDLLKWMVMAMIAQGTLIIAMVVAFLKLF